MGTHNVDYKGNIRDLRDLGFVPMVSLGLFCKVTTSTQRRCNLNNRETYTMNKYTVIKQDAPLNKWALCFEGHPIDFFPTMKQALEVAVDYNAFLARKNA